MPNEVLTPERLRIRRYWAMPSADTFSVKPIGEFVQRYLAQSQVSVDPFARNNRWATYTNDINPNTEAEEHEDAETFLSLMVPEKCDLAIFDPPYSPRQISECYKQIGREVGMEGTQNARLYKRVRDVLMQILTKDAVVLSFGWNSVGMGKERGFEIEEIMLCCHGAAHNDTIAIAERRIR